jgi:hypothetical protein
MTGACSATNCRCGVARVRHSRRRGGSRGAHADSQQPTSPAKGARPHDWQGRGVDTLLGSAWTERRPAAVNRLRTVVEADNRAPPALLARAGRMSPGIAHLGVLDVTVELAAA